MAFALRKETDCPFARCSVTRGQLDTCRKLAWRDFWPEEARRAYDGLLASLAPAEILPSLRLKDGDSLAGSAMARRILEIARRRDWSPSNPRLWSVKHLSACSRHDELLGELIRGYVLRLCLEQEAELPDALRAYLACLSPPCRPRQAEGLESSFIHEGV